MTDLNHDIPILDLDDAAIGRILTWLPATSALLRHASIRMTWEYAAPEMSAEAQFIDDLLTLSTEEICDKWYGGKLNASGFAAALNEMSVPRHVHPSALETDPPEQVAD